MKALTQYFSEKKDIPVFDETTKENCQFLKESRLMLSRCMTGDLETDEQAYNEGL